MTSAQLKETDYLKTWALFAVCATVGGFVAGAVLGGIGGGLLGAVGVPIKAIKIICGCLGFIAGLPVSYFCFRFFVARFIVQRLTEPNLAG